MRTYLGHSCDIKGSDGTLTLWGHRGCYSSQQTYYDLVDFHCRALQNKTKLKIIMQHCSTSTHPYAERQRVLRDAWDEVFLSLICSTTKYYSHDTPHQYRRHRYSPEYSSSSPSSPLSSSSLDCLSSIVFLRREVLCRSRWFASVLSTL